MLNRISHSFALLTCEISWSTLEINFISPHIHILFSIYIENIQAWTIKSIIINRNMKRLVYWLETLDFTIRIGSTPTFSYFDLYLYSAYAIHYVYYKSIVISFEWSYYVWTFFSFQDYRTPWKSILSSTCFWAIAVAHYCCNWGFYTLLTSMPAYFKEVLGVQISEVGGINC